MTTSTTPVETAFCLVGVSVWWLKSTLYSL